MRHDADELVSANVALLKQASVVLAALDDRFYARTVPGIPSLRVGAHIRHVLEFYECFLAGVPSRFIDYDKRRRDRKVESSRSAALTRIGSLMQRVERLDASLDAGMVWVRPEDTLEADAWIGSTVARELQVLSSHTIHHFALIAVTLQCFGVHVPPGFGVAPSTLRYRESLMAEETAA